MVSPAREMISSSPSNLPSPNENTPLFKKRRITFPQNEDENCFRLDSLIGLDLLIEIELIKEQQQDAKKILERYPDGLASKEKINLSHLGLKHLPPDILIQCSNAKELDISGNNIHWLPMEIMKLGLRLLNISGNMRLQPNLTQFPWLLNMKELNLIAHDMGFNFTPKGWSGRFESNEIPPGIEWMDDFTQDSGESF